MKKLLFFILALLFLPITVLAADEVSFAQNTNISIGGYTLTISAGGVADQMVVGSSNVTFTLSTNSSLTIQSTARANLVNSLNLDMLCGDSYSQINVSGNSAGSTLVVTPSGTCIGTTGGGGSSGGGGGGGGTPTPSSPTVPITTTGEVTATASAGGKTTLTTIEGAKASVELPANAVSASTVVKISSENKNTVISSKPIPLERNVVGNYIYNYTAVSNNQTITSFSKTLTLVFTYTDAQISGLDESTLLVYYWNESISQWIALSTAVNAATNTLTALSNHFTYFVILGAVPGAAEEEAVEEEAPAETPAEEKIVINDGDLVRNPSAEGLTQFDIYIVKLVGGKKFKRLILSPHVFESYKHFDKNNDGDKGWNDVTDISQAVIDSYAASDLIREVNDTKVYKLTADGDTGTKQWLNMSANDFSVKGYDADSIYNINAADRDAYTAGLDITASGASPSSNTIIIKVSSLRVRSLPSLSGEVLTQVHEGEVYDLLEEQNGWYKITANGITGWCYSGDTGGYAAKR
jgi:hypothetical protein